MVFSLKRRILIVVVIAVASLVGVGVGLSIWISTTHEQRRLHTHEALAAEIDRLTELASRSPDARRKLGRRNFGELKSGFLTDGFDDEEGVTPFGAGLQVLRAETAREAHAKGEVVLRDVVNAKGQPLVIGAAALPAGGYVWAGSLVGVSAQSERLRFITLFLALATALLVLASLHTLVVFQRGTRSILASLRLLASDLTAPVAQPKLSELGEIAEGVKQLAREVTNAEKEKALLIAELAKKERLAALGRVAAGVAHEVRNPLAAMKLRADLALENPALDPTLARDLGDISNEIARLDRFVRDLLVVAGPGAPTRLEKDLGAIARRRVALLQPWAEARGVDLVTKGEARAAVDEDAIARAIDNLVRNAVEASPRSVPVVVTIAATDAGAKIDVVDEGKGIEEARRDQLFEPFATTKTDGTGLGLALARAVAEAHGGSVIYARESDRTRFTLSIRR